MPITANLQPAAGGHVTVVLTVAQRESRRKRRAAAALDAAASACNATLCFDLGSFSGMMNQAEMAALARQMVECYGYNRRLASPFGFAVAGLQHADSQLLEALSVHSWEQWVLWRIAEPPWAAAAFSGKRLVYLTADAPEALGDETFDDNLVLIIGGLVDHASGQAGGARVGAALRVAEDAAACGAGHALHTARLPLDTFVTVRKPSLTCIACVQILAGFAASGAAADWGAAVREAPAMRCAPLKKYVRWK